MRYKIIETQQLKCKLIAIYIINKTSRNDMTQKKLKCKTKLILYVGIVYLYFQKNSLKLTCK